MAITKAPKHKEIMNMTADLRAARDEIEQWHRIGQFILDCIDHEGEPVIAIAKSHQDLMRKLLLTKESDNVG